jgi:topoisomerase-4 subunit A
MVDVDEFIGIKSHRAKGKRITTYEVATLRFIVPEEPEVEEVEDADEAIDDVDIDNEVDNELDAEDIMGSEIKADPTVNYSQKGESDEGFTAAQLDLF